MSVNNSLTKIEINGLHDLLNWWDATNGGKDGPGAYIVAGAIISNCQFVTSLKHIYMGQKSRLYDLNGLTAVDPGGFGQIDVGCRLSGLTNVEHVAWDLLPPGVHLLNLNKLKDINDQRIPDNSRLSGLGLVMGVVGTIFGKNVYVYGLSSLGSFTGVTFGDGGRFTNLKKLFVIENCKPAINVTFKFSGSCSVSASHFNGFDGVTFQGIDLCCINFDDKFPRNAEFDRFPNSNKTTGVLAFSAGTNINCFSVTSIDEIKPLYSDGAFLPPSIRLHGLNKSIVSQMPEWAHSRINFA